MNAIYYKLDIPNFKSTPFSVTNMLVNSLYFTAFPKISKYHKMCNALEPNLQITKSYNLVI